MNEQGAYGKAYNTAMMAGASAFFNNRIKQLVCGTQT